MLEDGTERLGMVPCAKKLNSDLPGSAQPRVLSQGVIKCLFGNWPEQQQYERSREDLQLSQ